MKLDRFIRLALGLVVLLIFIIAGILWYTLSGDPTVKEMLNPAR